MLLKGNTEQPVLLGGVPIIKFIRKENFSVISRTGRAERTGSYLLLHLRYIIAELGW